MTKDPWWQNDIKRLQEKKKIIIGSQEIIREYGSRLICPKCERGAFRNGTRDRARCNICGWEGPSLTIDEYMTEKFYRK